MGEVVDGGAAGVHGDFAGFLGDEGLGLVGEGVVEMNFGHGCGGQLMALVDSGIFRVRKKRRLYLRVEGKQTGGGESRISLR